MHMAGASSISAAGNDNPTNRVVGSVNNMWHTPATLTTMNPTSITNTGGSQAHTNMQPYLALIVLHRAAGHLPVPELGAIAAMAQPYVGEIRMFGGNFAPAGWMFCEGQLLPISENETLFQLIGTTYGGDGQSTFALPDLRGRIPIHSGTAGSASRRPAGPRRSRSRPSRSRSTPTRSWRRRSTATRRPPRARCRRRR